MVKVQWKVSEQPWLRRLLRPVNPPPPAMCVFFVLFGFGVCGFGWGGGGGGGGREVCLIAIFPCLPALAMAHLLHARGRRKTIALVMALPADGNDVRPSEHEFLSASVAPGPTRQPPAASSLRVEGGHTAETMEEPCAALADQLTRPAIDSVITPATHRRADHAPLRQRGVRGPEEIAGRRPPQTQARRLSSSAAHDAHLSAGISWRRTALDLAMEVLAKSPSQRGRLSSSGGLIERSLRRQVHSCDSCGNRGIPR